MILKLKRISPWSLAVVLTKMYFFVGVLAAGFLVILKAFSEAKSTTGDVFKGMLICLLVYPLVGFVSGGLIAFIYNVICRKRAGIEMELERLDTIESSQPDEKVN